MDDPLLLRGQTISVPATGPFDSSARFVPDMSPEAPIRIASVLGNFGRWFSGKTEDAATPAVLEWYELQRNASNSTIVKEVGGADQAATMLASAYWLMGQQPEGQEGPLATNGWGNVFYVRDISGQLRSLYIHWCDGAWSVDAMQIESIAEWPIRDRVFCPPIPAPPPSE